MLNYMVEKNTIKAYQTAFSDSLLTFRAAPPRRIAKKSGAVYNSDISKLLLPSLGQELAISYPEGQITFSGTKLKPVWSWSLMVLNYLGRADGTPLTGQLISYRETENGQVFYPAFYREAIRPLVKVVSSIPLPKIKKACLELGGRLENGGDICAIFELFPRFPLTIKIWQADDEFDGSANLLFDSCANHYLHTEDIAVAGILVSQFLIRQCENTETY